MQPNTGSFGAAIGGADPIKEAMARRGMGAGVTSQVSPAAATAAPTGAPAQPMVGPTGQPMPTGQPTAPAGMPPNTSESQIIVKALDSRLKTLSEIEKAGLGPI